MRLFRSWIEISNGLFHVFWFCNRFLELSGLCHLSSSQKISNQGVEARTAFLKQGSVTCLIFGFFQTRGVTRTKYMTLNHFRLKIRTSNVDHERFRSDSICNYSDLLVQMCLLKILINLSVGNCSDLLAFVLNTGKICWLQIWLIHSNILVHFMHSNGVLNLNQTK